MEYISSKEAASRWGISERLVQRFCTENRIPGAKKFGHYWMIPSDTARPQKRRQKASQETEYKSQLPVDDTCIVSMPAWSAPGEAEQILSALTGEAAELFEMELTYYRGQADSAHELARKLFIKSSFTETRLACLQALALCAIYRGSYIEWAESLSSISALKPWRSEAEAMKEMAIASVRLSFIDLSTVPDWLKSGNFGRLPEYGSFQAAFTYLKYLQLSGRFEAARHSAVMALTRKDFAENPIVRSYLELILASLEHSLNNDNSAKAHIRIALKYALPDGLYNILVENVGGLDTLLEDVMLAEGLDVQWRSVVRLYEQYKAGWMALGRLIIGEQWITDLTPREWEALKYATMGLSTAEISDRMGISTASVKKYLGSVYGKLSLNGRNDIKSVLPLYGTGESDKSSHFSGNE